MLKSSTRPHRSPGSIGQFFEKAVIAERHRLRSEGKDYGAASIHFVLVRSRVPGVPSRATIGRILDRAHLADRNKRKRPKASFRTIRSQYPNQRWQSDAFEISTGDGLQWTVIEIIDDATRFSIGIAVADAERVEPIMELFRASITEYGRPVLVHTDNGSSFNGSRFDKPGKLVHLLHELGIKTVTGKPNKPRSQGKVERAHQTIQRFISAQNPFTRSELEAAVLRYRHWYNHDRVHQSLGHNTTPAEAYYGRPKIAPAGDPIKPPPERRRVKHQRVAETVLAERFAHGKNGKFRYLGTVFTFGLLWTGQLIRLIHHAELIEFFDEQGTYLASCPWPPPRYNVGLGNQARKNTGQERQFPRGNVQ